MITASSARSARLFAAHLALALALALASACTGDPAETATLATSTASDSNGQTSTSGASQSSTSAATDGSSASSSSSSSTTTATTGPECVDDSDCDDGLYCLDGWCAFCPNVAPDDPGGLSPRCLPCGEASIDLPIAAPNVVFVVDKSGSMVSHELDHDGDPETPPTTRWFALHGALFELLSTYDGSLSAGLSLFPSLAAKSIYDASACPVADALEVPVAPQNGATIFAALPPKSATSAEIAGATPTRLGLVNAVDHLSAQGDGLAAAIVLITDGAANCQPDAASEQERFEVYDAALVDVVTDAAALGITTYVVGLDVADVTSPIELDGEPDDHNNHAALSELAVAGGGATEDPDEPFYSAADGPALVAALAAIRDRLLPCDVALDPPPAFPEVVEVEAAGVVYPDPIRDCATEDGWRFTDDNFDHIELCGLACADFRAAGFVTVEYRCALD